MPMASAATGPAAEAFRTHPLMARRPPEEMAGARLRLCSTAAASTVRPTMSETAPAASRKSGATPAAPTTAVIPNPAAR